jgi:hypothetical protein
MTMRTVPAQLLAGLLVSICACSTPSVEGTEPSPEALGAAVIDAVERRDLDRLRALALNEDEFRDVVWPDLPAARPERNLPFEYVWNDLRMKSASSLARTLDRFAETPMTLVRVRFDGATSQHRHHLVHRETVLVVRMSDGSEQDVRLFGSVLEQRGRYKVFSYNVE